MGDWQTVVQYNEEGTPPYVRDVCRAITNATLPKAPLQRLAAATALFNATRKCIPSSWEKDMAAPLRHAQFSPPGCNLTCASDRQWTWQTQRVWLLPDGGRPRPAPSPPSAPSPRPPSAGAICEPSEGHEAQSAWANVCETCGRRT